MSIGNLVEIVSYHLVETCQHIHTYIASSRDMCYHMYIHIEITVCARTHVLHAKYWLGKWTLLRQLYPY